MNERSPYQTPAAPAFDPVPPPFAAVPTAVNVFGVLHLVFAALGILGVLWALFVAIYGNPLLNSAARNESLIAMQAKTAPVSVVTSIIGLLVSAVMIIAGIKLLKKRGSGLRWSNIYAVSSLLAKTVNLVLTFLIVVPAMREFTRAASSAISTATVAGVIGGVLLTCLYPALSLILLNRPAVKEWFAARPG